MPHHIAALSIGSVATRGGECDLAPRPNGGIVWTFVVGFAIGAVLIVLVIVACVRTSSAGTLAGGKGGDHQ
jgi:hypothetical protein